MINQREGIVKIEGIYWRIDSSLLTELLDEFVISWQKHKNGQIEIIWFEKCTYLLHFVDHYMVHLVSNDFGLVQSFNTYPKLSKSKIMY